MIYPDGTKISWKYDSLLRPVQMNRTAAGRDPLWTQYQYDGQGRLSEKRTSGGYTARWQRGEAEKLALFDTEKEESVSYYCPVLAEDSDGGKEALYWIKRREGYEIRICEELAESLLERGAVGMELGE